MSPKDKAQELVDKFNLPTGLMTVERKQCALLLVDEMQKLLNGVIHDDCWWSNSDYYLQDVLTPTQYLEKVKIEIDKL